LLALHGVGTCTKVVREYGRYTHASGGQNMNNGIDLQCKSGASVQAVFNGTVSRVFTCPNGTRGIIVRHGDYMSVYANMGSVTVKEGSKVSTKQNLGTVYTNEEGTSEFSFQLWKGTASQNPRTWLR
jgi:septal ring factor EnvC (AmiA/AmiB activator)